MALLPRFRKLGGFLQLVQLVETTEPRRRQELIQLIAKEDPGWAQVVRLKILTPERIMGWSYEALGVIWQQVPIPMIVTLWQKSPATQRAAIENSLPRAFKTAFKKALESIQGVDESEATAAGLRLVSIVREMIIHSRLDPEFFDPTLAWDPDVVEAMDPFKLPDPNTQVG